MNTVEKNWLSKCQNEPDKYKISIDNDDVFVEDLEENQCVFSFENYGQYFIQDILKHFGFNVELV